MSQPTLMGVSREPDLRAVISFLLLRLALIYLSLPLSHPVSDQLSVGGPLLHNFRNVTRASTSIAGIRKCNDGEDHKTSEGARCGRVRTHFFQVFTKVISSVNEAWAIDAASQ